jgi:hypothetical protein
MRGVNLLCSVEEISGQSLPLAGRADTPPRRRLPAAQAVRGSYAMLTAIWGSEGFYPRITLVDCIETGGVDHVKAGLDGAD